jgi:hypothetical protein
VLRVALVPSPTRVSSPLTPPPLPLLLLTQRGHLDTDHHLKQKMQQPTSRPASTSTRPGPSPRPFQVNTQTKLIDTVHGRILCLADVRGRLSSLNDLAREANAKAIIHTGDFGFFGPSHLFFPPLLSRSLS